MSLFDALFGNTRRARPKMDAVFALPAALVDMELRGIRSLGVGGVCVRAPEGAAFAQAGEEIRRILDLYRAERSLDLRTPGDDLGYTWWVLEAPGRAIDDVATGLHMVGDEYRQRGYGDALVAAAFPLEEVGAGPFTLIYNYRRGLYYPFVPLAGRHERDNAREIRLADLLPPSLPRESELDRWYALWDAPLGRARALPDEEAGR
ncbi:MAG: hypothetical protein K6V73_04300 [Firmicutes bacterium]|nr:hypothetical protein [Bacillota bacterium]